MDIETEQPPIPVFDKERILLIENALSAEICAQLCAHIEKAWQTKPDEKVDTYYRSAFVPPNGEMQEKLKQIYHHFFKTEIEPFFGVMVEWWESPQLLRYTKGGKYDPHSDSERWIRDATEPHWEREYDRDISVLIYLNDNFTGGKLTFPEHNRKITPKPGLLVAFPSTHEYRHGAEPTEEGIRYLTVTWAAAKGFPRVREKPMPNSIFMKDCR